MKKIMRKQSIYIYLFLGLLAAIILIPINPVSESIPKRDSGVFLYVGQQILEGKIPYRDVWDHKGPGIYYVDAVGLLIGQGSRWGVWFLEFLSLFVAASLGYRVMSQAFGTMPAIFASVIWLISLPLLFIYEKGNVTEEFSLPIQFATLYLFWRLSQKPGVQLKYGFLIGVMFALSFLLRPNNVGIQISVAILIFFYAILSSRRIDAFTQVLALGGGAAIIILPVIIYFAWNNTFSHLSDEILRYNSIYAVSTFENKTDSAFFGLQLLMQSGITITALAAWFFECFNMVNRTNTYDKITPIRHLALIGLPIELVLSSLAGRNYDHYYITWLPIFALLTGLFAFEFAKNFSSSEAIFLKRKINAGSAWLVALLAAMAFLPLNEIIPSAWHIVLSNEHQKPSAVVEEIRNYAGDDSYLLMWGAETTFNFLTEKQAPSRFVYQYPLYTCGYFTENMIDEFLDDIVEKKPLIVDTSSRNKFIPPLDDDRREKWRNVFFAGYDTCKLSPQMNNVFDFINSNYSVVDVIKSNKWTIYKYTESEEAGAASR